MAGCGGGSSCDSGSCGSADAKIAQQDMAISSSLGRIKNKLLVMSGKGGVGKSTVSVNLALGLANRGYKVGLMDVDLHGPDICRMLNLTNRLMDADVKEDGLLPPMQVGENLKVISLEYMMEDRDAPVIWRGPMKVQAIRQFIADMDWGDLDYLIIDAPPGTGDEPLTVAQTIGDACAVVVTTPQQIALADVRKSLNFCKQLEMEVIGIVENMSGFVCPHCSETVEIFKSGGGQEIADDFNLRFLGKVPIDPRVVSGGDDGTPFLSGDNDSPAATAFQGVVGMVEQVLSKKKKVDLPMADTGSSCGCGGKCNPDTCDC